MRMFRRRREKKTHYRQRLGLLKSGSVRLVVRRSINNIHIQAVEYGESGDKTVSEVSAKNLKEYGWKGHPANLPAAYLTGFLIGMKCLKSGIKQAILDIGLQTPVKKNAVYAAVSGAVDAGLEIPVNKAILPDKDRIKGLHIAAYAKKIKEDKEKYEKQFSMYLKSGLDPEKLPDHFEETKKKISESG
jgi:large subunit ribosomal protein L18